MLVVHGSASARYVESLNLHDAPILRGQIDSAGGNPQVAMNGDIVHVHYICKYEEGDIVYDSANSEEPVCFEVEPLHLTRSQHESTVLHQGIQKDTRTLADASSIMWATEDDRAYIGITPLPDCCRNVSLISAYLRMIVVLVA